MKMSRFLTVESIYQDVFVFFGRSKCFMTFLCCLGKWSLVCGTEMFAKVTPPPQKEKKTDLKIFNTNKSFVLWCLIWELFLFGLIKPNSIETIFTIVWQFKFFDILYIVYVALLECNKQQKLFKWTMTYNWIRELQIIKGKFSYKGMPMNWHLFPLTCDRKQSILLFFLA